MKRFLLVFCAVAACSHPDCFAGMYVQQSSFTLPMSAIAAMDSDAVGNLYVLGLPPGATTYAVTGHRTPGLDSFVSFDTGLSSPAAFAVEASGVVDVLDSQQLAFRWGARLGNLLYNSRMDLEPSQPTKGDGDIDAKDLQFVYGRHGSTCKDPHPA